MSCVVLFFQRHKKPDPIVLGGDRSPSTEGIRHCMRLSRIYPKTYCKYILMLTLP